MRQLSTKAIEGDFVSTTTEEVVVTITCEMRTGFPPIHSQKKNRSTSPIGKVQGKESEKEKVTVALVNVANHRLWNTSGKLLQIETSRNTHLKADEHCEQVGQSKMPTKRILALGRTLAQFSYQSLETKIQRQISIYERDPHRQQKRKISKYTTVRCTEWTEEQGEFETAWSTQTSQGALQDERTQPGCLQNGLFLESYVFLRKAMNTANGLGIHTKERMHIVDGGATLHLMGSSSLIKNQKEDHLES